jgi:hypothetical protein
LPSSPTGNAPPVAAPPGTGWQRRRPLLPMQARPTSGGRSRAHTVAQRRIGLAIARRYGIRRGSCCFATD